MKNQMTKTRKPRRSAGSVLYVGEIKVGDEVKSFRLYGTHLLSLRARIKEMVSINGGLIVPPSKDRIELKLTKPVKLDVSLPPPRGRNILSEGVVVSLLEAAENERMRRLREGLDYFFSLSNERRPDYWTALREMEYSMVSVRGFPRTSYRILYDVYLNRAYSLDTEFY